MAAAFLADNMRKERSNKILGERHIIHIFYVMMIDDPITSVDCGLTSSMRRWIDTGKVAWLVGR